MASKDFISIQQLCIHYNIPMSFVNALKDYELIDIVVLEETPSIEKAQIKNMEKLIRLHYELDINLEGMHAISNLLNKVATLQKEINKLHNKLNFFEDR